MVVNISADNLRRSMGFCGLWDILFRADYIQIGGGACIQCGQICTYRQK